MSRIGWNFQRRIFLKELIQKTLVGMEMGQAFPGMKVLETTDQTHGLEIIVLSVLNRTHAKLPLFVERTSKGNIFFYCSI